MTKCEPTAEKSNGDETNLAALSTERLKELRAEIDEELAARENSVDLDDASSIELVSNKWAKWGTLSAHANTKAVKPWILHVTDEHQKYGVDGDWLNKNRIDGAHHMDMSGLSAGDIIKVSGASHNNKKHRHYRILAFKGGTMHYEQITEAETVEEVSA
jgi:hypothetical protein